ncbi:hypothetical protein EGH21_12625 [Halomicroarcula sp. F13]|uniref:Uncharacterized protein n=1 Tax=Haloarcula rubra TaxID=2487747 RepID=A0AAW4PRK2_9EURY|nr:hypothetical protein [Halomicroarcula rubra]MBX0323875.1 hypothetical protein [Halomicroarcula rubra]
MSDLVEFDDVRLSDLSLGGWLGLVIAGVGLWAIGKALVEWVMLGNDPLVGLVAGGFFALIGAMLAYDNGLPECEAHCEACGGHIRSQSSRDGVSEFVEVRASGTPRRASVGPLTVVTERNRREWTYCSGECAAADAESRLLVGHVETEAIRTAEVDDAT